ncbi:hypothetical protein AB3515_13750 [Acinetobacter baumannii]
MLNITTKDLNKFVDISGEKIEISSSNNMKLDGINVYSNGNLSLHADKDIYLNTVLPNSWTGVVLVVKSLEAKKAYIYQ